MGLQRSASWYEPPAYPRVIARCVGCGDEFTHPAEFVVLDDEDILCDDPICIYKFLEKAGRLRRLSSIDELRQ